MKAGMAKLDLFKKVQKTAKTATMSMGNMSLKEKMEQKRLKEEKEQQLEAFRKKREQIRKHEESRKKMAIKVNKIQMELLGLTVEDNAEEGEEAQIPDDELLSVSSAGSGKVFVKNIMGFWT